MTMAAEKKERPVFLSHYGYEIRSGGTIHFGFVTSDKRFPIAYTCRESFIATGKNYKSADSNQIMFLPGLNYQDEAKVLAAVRKVVHVFEESFGIGPSQITLCYHGSNNNPQIKNNKAILLDPNKKWLASAAGTSLLILLIRIAIAKSSTFDFRLRNFEPIWKHITGKNDRSADVAFLKDARWTIDLLLKEGSILFKDSKAWGTYNYGIRSFTQELKDRKEKERLAAVAAKKPTPPVLKRRVTTAKKAAVRRSPTPRKKAARRSLAAV